MAVSKQDERMTSRGVSLEDYKWELYSEKAKKHGFKTRNDFIRAGWNFISNGWSAEIAKPS